LGNTFKFKGGALGIAQIALATKQEGVAGGIYVAISWGVGILTGWNLFITLILVIYSLSQKHSLLVYFWSEMNHS
jgi:hypothetical protein